MKNKRIKVLEEQRRRDNNRLKKIDNLAHQITNITRNTIKGRAVKKASAKKAK